MKRIVLLRTRKCMDFSWLFPLTLNLGSPKRVVQIVLKIGWSFYGCSKLQQTTKTYIQPHFKVMWHCSHSPLSSTAGTLQHPPTQTHTHPSLWSHPARMPQHLGLFPICLSPIAFIRAQVGWERSWEDLPKWAGPVLGLQRPPHRWGTPRSA